MQIAARHADPHTHALRPAYGLRNLTDSPVPAAHRGRWHG